MGFLSHPIITWRQMIPSKRRLAITGLVSLLGALLPLCTTTGRNLEYEYIFLMGLAQLLTMPLIPLWFKADIHWTLHRDEKLFFFLIGPLLSQIPALILFATNMCRCSAFDYSFWLTIQWAPQWLLAAALWVFTAKRPQMSRGRAIGALVVGLLFSVIHLAAILWLFPQKRVTHFIFGILHGPIYDEWIPTNHAIVAMRLVHALIPLAVLIYCAWHQRRRTMIWVSGCLLAAFTVYATYRGAPSVGHGEAVLQRELPDTLQGNGFVVHYRSMLSQKNIRQLFTDIQFHMQELTAILGQPPRPVHIYIYPSRQQMKLWFGGEQTDMTDVVTPSVHITASEYPHETLRHELVHALASFSAFYGLGFHPNMAFTEGFAVALAPTPQRLTLDQGAALLLASKKLPAIEQIFSPLFWKESGPRAYTVAGSFVKFLIQEYGIEPVKKLYAGEPWNKAFSISLEEAINHWQTAIAPLADKKLELQANRLYRSPGVLFDQCPHSKATYLQDSDQDAWLNWRQPVSWDEKTQYWPWRLRINPNDTAAAQVQWQRRIKEVAATENRVALNELREELLQKRVWPPAYIEAVEQEISLADIEFLLDLNDEATKRLEDLKQYYNDAQYGDDLYRQVIARQEIAALPADAARAWRLYLAGFASTLPHGEYRADDPWIVSYLQIRREVKDERSLKQMLQKSVPTSLPATFASEWYRLLAEKFFQAEDFNRAAEMYALAAQLGPPATKAWFEEQTRRSQFHQQTRLSSKR